MKPQELSGPGYVLSAYQKAIIHVALQQARQAFQAPGRAKGKVKMIRQLDTRSKHETRVLRLW